MLRLVRKYPVLCTSVAVMIVSLVAIVWLGFRGPLVAFIFVPLIVANVVVTVITNLRLFGVTPNSTIYGPHSHREHDNR